MTSNRTIHVRIHGRVQGVGFRAWVQHQAELHGLKGWVRNRYDGSVEAVFSGTGDQVEAMLKACNQGPASAAVQWIEPVDEGEVEFDSSGEFQVLRTV